MKSPQQATYLTGTNLISAKAAQHATTHWKQMTMFSNARHTREQCGAAESILSLAIQLNGCPTIPDYSTFSGTGFNDGSNIYLPHLSKHTPPNTTNFFATNPTSAGLTYSVVDGVSTGRSITNDMHR